MLITNRRLRALFVALAGMEACIVSTFLLLILRWRVIWAVQPPADAFPPLTLLLVLWVGLLGMIATVDLLAQSDLEDEIYRTSVVVLVGVTALLAVRGFAVPIAGASDRHWIMETIAAVVNVHQGLQPATFVLLVSGYLWFRAAAMTGIEVNFFGVGVSFRLGMLLTILGGGILAVRYPSLVGDATLLFLLYLGNGLLAVALARSDEKAEAASGSTGSALPLDRLLQLLLIVVISVGAPLLVAQAYTPDRIVATIHLLDPLWFLLGRIGILLLSVAVVALEWIVSGIYTMLAPLFAQMEIWERLSEAMANLQMPEPQEAPSEPAGEPWRYTPLLLLALRLLGAIAVAAIVLGLIYIFLVRRRRRHSREPEEASIAAGRMPASPLGRGMDRLRRWLSLVRQYGIGTRLLDAITVENIYANLARIARQRGHPRRPAQPPDEYLPALQSAFPGNERALRRITDAYMRVHYGDLPVGGDELRDLRQEYERVKQTPPASEHRSA